jgi:hypothetical protein
VSDDKESVVEWKAKIAGNEHFPMYRVCQKFIKMKAPNVLRGKTAKQGVAVCLRNISQDSTESFSQRTAEVGSVRKYVNENILTHFLNYLVQRTTNAKLFDELSHSSYIFEVFLTVYRDISISHEPTRCTIFY